MVITWQTIVTAASVLAAVIAILKAYNSVYDLVKHQKEQDTRIAAIDKGQTAVLEALLGVLNGQIEQGCNGQTHAARDKLQAYLVERGNVK